MAYEPEPLSFEPSELKGISEKAIMVHYEKLYMGYVRKFNEIQEKLATADLENANHNYSEWRELGLEKTYNADGILLHELYFENLGGDGKPGDFPIVQAIEEQYDSVDEFKKQMTATAMGARGWAIAAWSPLDGAIDIFAQDAHNVGVVVGMAPLLVLDVYEHAYFMDYGSDRKSYIEAFWQNVDWEVVDARYGDVTSLM